MSCSECTNPYKFEINDIAYVQSVVGVENMPVVILCRYTSDVYTHPASPHRRYFVKVMESGVLSDFSEAELTEEEVMF